MFLLLHVLVHVVENEVSRVHPLFLSLFIYLHIFIIIYIAKSWMIGLLQSCKFALSEFFVQVFDCFVLVVEFGRETANFDVRVVIVS